MGASVYAGAAKASMFFAGTNIVEAQAALRSQHRFAISSTGLWDLAVERLG